ncbi:probable RNA-binding protein 46 [Drosophila takahashii]|uniref:probable RNA-binding protein 46 n=1 Tax=Drosophila takahashii TaxID=29030 RepID=UPI0038992CC7
MDFESYYRTSQVNGTISITTRQVLDEDLKSALEEGEGELYLTCIPRDRRSSPEKIVQLASELGEIYALRFKIDYAGNSRGYAYLQYINPPLKEAAMEYLPKRFLQMNLPIKVMTSLNKRELLLNQVQSLRPWQVYQEMRKIFPFAILRVYEYQSGKFIYIFGYRNNDTAANAHQTIRNTIRRFGARAHISWLCRKHFLSGHKLDSPCCQKLDENHMLLVTSTDKYCFTI